MTHQNLNLFMGPVLCGQLEISDKNTVKFTYAPEWLSHKEAFPLSLSMPLSTKTYTGKKIETFFSLMVGRRKITDLAQHLLHRNQKVLTNFHTEAEFKLEKKYSTSTLDQVEHEMVEDLTSGKRQRLNIYNQSQYELNYAHPQIYLPIGRARCYQTLVSPSPDHQGLLENQYIHNQLQRDLGLPTPRTQILTSKNRKFLLESKVDAPMVNGKPKIFHSETMMQSLGLTNGTLKNIGLKKIFTHIRELSMIAGKDTLMALKYICLNHIIGNTHLDLNSLHIAITPTGCRLIAFKGLISYQQIGESAPVGALKLNYANVNDFIEHLAETSGIQKKLVKSVYAELEAQTATKLSKILKDLYNLPLVDWQTLDQFKRRQVAA